MADKKNKVGFFGGSFDPVHKTHLSLADAAVHQFQLDPLYLIPAARNPLKEEPPLFSDEARHEMLEAAVTDRPKIAVLDLELHRPAPSYTIDTVTALQRLVPQAELFALIGADILPALPRWKDIATLCQHVRFLVFPRDSYKITPPAALPALHLATVDHPADDASATEIRDRLRDGRSVADLLPAAARDAFHKHLSSASLTAPIPA